MTQRNKQTMTTTIKVLGFTDSITTCDLCGKSELKGTYSVDSEGQIFHLGSTCVGKKNGLNAKDSKSFISSELKARKEEYLLAQREIRNRESIALLNIDFWEQHDEYKRIQKPFKNELSTLRENFIN